LASCALASSGTEIVVGLKLQRLDKLEAAFWEISNPRSPRYLSFMNLTTLADLIGPSPAAVNQAKAWLLTRGADPESIRVSAMGDRVTATVPKRLEVAAATEYDELFDFVLHRNANKNSSSLISSSRKALRSASGRYSIKAQKQAYGIPEDLQASNPRTLQMVWGPGTFGYSKSQLSAFKEEQCPLLNMDKVVFDTENHGQAGGDNYGEGNLDVSMIASFGLNITTLVSNTNTSMSTEEGNGFGEAMLDFITALANRDTLPQVLSLSLGSLSAYSCDLLCDQAVKKGHERSDCEAFMQEQRQVCMYLSQDQVGRINTALQVLGVRGVSVFGSSGDGGSHFSFDRFSGTSELANDLNDISCSFQMPVFPTSSPYITSVGGTVWKGTLFPDPSHPVAWSRTGGGFAWQFPRPPHQDKMVSDYLQSTSGLPPASSYNTTARGYPDVSAVSEEGTSQSSPTVAGIFSLLTDLRLQRGLKPLGFLGPRLYMVAEKFPGEAFQDVTQGTTAYHCDNGFPSAKGWDPVTGLGRPVWEGLKRHFASDDTVVS